MTTEALLKALARLRVETGSLACLGCGYEHNCSVHGCQLLREAAAQLEHFTAENRALRNALPSGPVKHSQKQTLDACVAYLREIAKELNAQREKAEAERDALLEYAKLFTGCDTCKHSNYCKTDSECNACEQDVKGNCYCKDCERGSNWEWRGLPETPEEGEKDA